MESHVVNKPDIDLGFKGKVSNLLKELTHENICFFMWLCFTRSLPFLGAEGNFDYWKKTKHSFFKNTDRRNNYLLAIFKALDYAAVYDARLSDFASKVATYEGTKAVQAAADAYNDDEAAREAAYNSLIASIPVSTADIFVYVSANFITDAALDAANAGADDTFEISRAISRTLIKVAKVARDTVEEKYNPTEAYYTLVMATADAAATIVAVGRRNNIDLAQILLRDLKTIKNGECDFYCDTGIYGVIWGNFQNALRGIGCEYWGNWYTSIFNKGLILDNDDKVEIELRQNAPVALAKWRAAASVAHYVIKQKKKTRNILSKPICDFEG